MSTACSFCVIIYGSLVITRESNIAPYVKNIIKPNLQALQNYCKWLEFGIIPSESEFSLKTQIRMTYLCLLSFYRAVSTEEVSFKVCNLFLSKCIQDQYLIQLLRNADSVSTWVAAEIVTCHTSKVCCCFVVLLWNIYMLMCIHMY